jgi:hypothetical protein
MSLREYLAFFHSAVGKIDDYGFADSIDINVEIRASKQVAIKVIIILVDQSILQIKEYIDAKYKIEKISYAYQYQNEEGRLIFRYDNARHKPDLGFKDHKHLNDGSIMQCDVPNVTDVVDEVIEHL